MGSPVVHISLSDFYCTDREIAANKPDIVVRDKAEKKAYIIDIACPADLNVEAKENEKVLKYISLKNELHRMWDCKVEIVPVVIGCQGVVTKSFKTYLELLPGCHSFKLMQRTTLFGSEVIMRKFTSSRKNKK